MGSVCHMEKQLVTVPVRADQLVGAGRVREGDARETVAMVTWW